MINSDVSYRKRGKKFSKRNRVYFVKFPSDPKASGNSVSNDNCLRESFILTGLDLFPISIEDGDS